MRKNKYFEFGVRSSKEVQSPRDLEKRLKDVKKKHSLRNQSRIVQGYLEGMPEDSLYKYSHILKKFDKKNKKKLKEIQENIQYTAIGVICSIGFVSTFVLMPLGMVIDHNERLNNLEKIENTKYSENPIKQDFEIIGDTLNYKK